MACITATMTTEKHIRKEIRAAAKSATDNERIPRAINDNGKIAYEPNLMQHWDSSLRNITTRGKINWRTCTMNGNNNNKSK